MSVANSAESDIREQPATVVFAIFSVLFLVIFNYTLTLMGSIYIVGELGASNYMTIYTVVFFGIGNALGVPLGKPLSDRHGIVSLLGTSLFLLAIFSFVCGIATNYPLFLAGRFFQGLVTGPLYILINRLISSFETKKTKDSYTAITLTIFTVGPVIGASWGGWISYDYHWRWLFFFNIPIIVFVAAYLQWRLKGYDHVYMRAIKFDFVGYYFFAIAIFCLSFILATGQEFDWHRSPLLRTMAIIGVPSLIFFVLWDYNHPEPVINFRLLKHPIFLFGLFNLAILFSAYFGMVILLALWLSLYVNYTPIWVAVLIGTMALAGFLPTFLVSKKMGQIDARIPLAIAIVLLTISSFHTAYFDVDINFGRVAYSRILAGFGLAFFLPPIFRLCFRTHPPKHSLDVIVIFQIVRALSSGLGASLYIILWQRREIFYHDRLGSQLTAFSQLTDNYFVDAKSFSLRGSAATAELDVLLERQSFSLALDDCFYLMGWIMVGLFFLMLLTQFLDRKDFIPELKAASKSH